MKVIRTTDSKGRLSLGESGRSYSLREEGGHVVLTPIEVPHPPVLSNEAVRGVYIHMEAMTSHADTLTLYSKMGAKPLADLAAQLSKSEMVPVIVDTTGVGAGVADLLRQNHPDVTVIEITPKE